MLTIKAEASPGEHVAEAITELCILASRLGCMVSIDFNGVGLTAKPGADPRDLLEKWRRLQNSDQQYKYACAQPMQLERDPLRSEGKSAV